MADNVPGKERLTFFLEFDHVTGLLSQQLHITPGIKNGSCLQMMSNAVARLHFRLLHDQVEDENARIAAAQASKIVPATTMPPEKVAGRIQAGRH